MPCRTRELPLDSDGVLGIILIDGSLVGTPPAKAAVESMALRMSLAGGMDAFLALSFEDMLLGERSSQDADRLRTRFCSVPLDFAREALLGIVAWDAQFSGSRLAALNVPLCLIQSTDRGPQFKRARIKTPEQSPWLQFALSHAPSAGVEIVADAGHFPQIDQPDVVNAAIERFIAEVSRNLVPQPSPVA